MSLRGILRDESQDVVRVLQGGELPVGSVAHAAHGPDDEGRRPTRHRSAPEDDHS